ncbi:LptF/LptG family permease [Desulfocurvus sp.]|uniref:LptF/LptG family permease n=1 Tax=Desulfocurvus sp. TaxID=2871698 RepID=UPI0025B84DE5|nr:LptF/LptG family permease [Desulfocurvus sp.]MCK9239335.1 LptF/LptG family permease [Desulfocurvus sp.]
MRARVLTRYLLRQNLFYLLSTLAVGTALYLMSDLFDRLDDFMEAGLGLGTALRYFAVKIPLIISQIMPAVFLVSVVVQLCLMARSRELLALRSGGVSLASLTRFVVLYSLLWCLGQLLFSQFVGVYGEREAGRIWSEQVRGNIVEKKELANIWFKDGDWVVELDRLWPARGAATGVTVFEMNADRQSLRRIISAARAEAAPGLWRLVDVRELHPGDFSTRTVDELELPFQQDPATFLLVAPGQDPSHLPIWTLSRVIGELDASGSNVERLLTSWHMKWAYAFSVLAMGLIALAMVTLFENVYLNVALSLVVTFAYYAVFMIGVTLGQKGILPPWAGAWLGNMVFYALAGGRLAWTAWPHRPTAA